MSAVRRHEVLDWARETSEQNAFRSSDWSDAKDRPMKRYIIEDDYDSEFRMRGRPIPPLFMQDAQGSVIYMNTFTRSLGSVFRIAYMVLPPQLLTTFNERFTARACMVGALEQLELARFITSGDYERHVNRQRTAYRRLQDSLVAKIMASEAGNYVRFKGVGSGLHFLMEVDLPAGDRSATPFENASLERGIRLVNIETYRSAFPNHSTKDRRTMDPRALDPATMSSPSDVNLHPHTTDPCTTYVMNVSGLDSERIDEIATALSDALLTSISACS